ncbi:DB domain-containing protein [Aphelenchoides bicaudatus]|nr:DB domain-containing protein [Aphelenchoides bicaudatus]
MTISQQIPANLGLRRLRSFSSTSFYAHQKQRQNHSKLSLTLLSILIISYVNGQNDFHYANESPNGGVRQFVDNQDVITSTPEAATTPKQQDANFDNLPECSMIPNLLCCTSRVLQKCYDGCLKHVQVKCAHKLRQFEHFKAGNHFVDRDISQQPLPAALDNDTDLLNKRQHSGQNFKRYPNNNYRTTYSVANHSASTKTHC